MRLTAQLTIAEETNVITATASTQSGVGSVPLSADDTGTRIRI
jgi:hypothetical protein